jgi:uncharacterized membrane protein
VARRALFRIGPLPKGRVEAFSDGVLAVVITLLVFEIRIPAGLKSEAAIWAAVGQASGALAAWAVSFAFVLTFWVSHHYFFAGLKHTDRGLLWLNGLFLLTVTLIPIQVGLIVEYPGFRAPIVVLSAEMALTSSSFTLMRAYASLHARLSDADARRTRRAILLSAAAPALYLAAFGLAFIWPPGAVAIQIFVLVLFFVLTAGGHADADAHAN